MTKRKADYPQTEVEITPELRELLEGFTEEEIETGVVAGGFAPAEPGSEVVEPALLEDLLARIREAGDHEAGAILRGEREAARRTPSLLGASATPRVRGGASSHPKTTD